MVLACLLKKTIYLQQIYVAGLKVGNVAAMGTVIIFDTIIIIIIIIIIVIVIELTDSKTILEINVEIEPQPAALDFMNFSQYSSRSK